MIEDAPSIPPTTDAPRAITTWRDPLLLVALGLALYLPGIRWGLPATVSWSQDSIAATRTLGAVAGWPSDWAGRYPPLHYFVLYAAYQPSLRHWESTGAMRRNSDGTIWFAPPHAPKVATLILVARVISVLMAIGAGLGVYAAAMVLTGSAPTALLAAAALMIGADFTYFAHLDNVDAASIFWFAWSCYFLVRLERSHRYSDAVWLALFAAAAMTTKDSLAGMYPGMAAVLVAQYARRLKAAGLSWAPALGRALVQPHWLVGLVAFVVVVMVVNGASGDWSGYMARLRYWVDPPPDSLHARQLRYDGTGALAMAVVHYAASAVGWPMIVAMLAGAAYAARRHRRIVVLTLIPVAGYLVIVIGTIDFVYARFLFAPLALLGICAAVGWMDLARSGVPGWLRSVMLVTVFTPTLAYAAAVNAEMLRDSRYDAEAWFEANVPRSATVGAFAMGSTPELRPQYLPRVHEMGYATYPVVMARDWFDRPQPEYLVLSSHTYEDFDASQRACMADLIAGRLGYAVVASFDAHHLRGGSWLAAAGFGTPEVGKISPKLIILRREGPATQ